MTENNSPPDRPNGSGLSRRTFVYGAGIAGLAAATGIAQGQQPENTNQQMNGVNSLQITGNSFELGGRRIVGEAGYKTIEDAWNDADDGDTIYVHASYDASKADESFPILLDYREKEVMLSGGHPSGSVIDATGSTNNIIEIIGRGSRDYRNNPVVQNLKLVGGQTGLRVARAPFASFQNLIFYENGEHGSLIAAHPDNGTFGTNWYNCQAWNCGGHGFTMETAAEAHGTTYFGCRATSNRGIGFRLRGFTCKIIGGTTQLNFNYGIEARSGKGSLVQGMYIEGNARGNDFPVELYANNADGLSVNSCYFHGVNPRSVEHNHNWVQRGVNVHQTEQLSVRDCTVRRYGDGFIALFGCTDADVHSSSHYFDSADLFALDPNGRGNLRTRSDGMILPTNLSSVAGAHEFDQGIHKSSNGNTGLAIWYNGGWHSVAAQPL